ncbi:hypothetical protein [Phaffia rhodozyma]|uniref:Transmembrane protein n=1 Tax=Phaffia rhodozyma TaxID=264483 RepID=A0A0F7SUQ6_PHARH|nr:hypothetical protein [Phaffia rhodozyma]
MSKAAKRTLWGSIGVTCLTILGVHYGQVQESNNMYRGVLRDEERMKLRELAKASGESLANTLIPATVRDSLPSSSTVASIFGSGTTPSQPSPSSSPSPPTMGSRPVNSDSVLGFEPPTQSTSKTDAQREKEKKERAQDFERSQQRLRQLVGEQGGDTDDYIVVSVGFFVWMQSTTAEDTVSISNLSPQSTPAVYHSFPTSLEAVTKAIEAFERQYPNRRPMNNMQSSANLYGHQEEMEEAQVADELSTIVNGNIDNSVPFPSPPSTMPISIPSEPITAISPYPGFEQTPSWPLPTAVSSSSSHAQTFSRPSSEKEHTNLTSISFYPVRPYIPSTAAVAAASTLPPVISNRTNPGPMGIQLGLVEGQPSRYGLRSSLSRISTPSSSSSIRDLAPKRVTAYPSPSRGSSQGSLAFGSDLSSLTSEVSTSSEEEGMEDEMIKVVASPRPRENSASSSGPWMTVPVAANWGETPGPMVVREPFVVLDEADLIEEVSEVKAKDKEDPIEEDLAASCKRKSGPSRRSSGKMNHIKDEPDEGQAKDKGKRTEKRKYTRRATTASATSETPTTSGRISELPDSQTASHTERRKYQPRRKSLPSSSSSSSSSLAILPSSSLSDRPGSTRSSRVPPSPLATDSNQLLPIRRRAILAFPPRKSQAELGRAPSLTTPSPTVSSGSSTQTRTTTEKRTERCAEDGRMIGGD